MAYATTTTLRRRLLGSKLRRLREEQGVSGEQIARKLDVEPSRIWRQESGHIRISVPDVVAYCELYGVTDPSQRERMEDLARHGRKRGWWSAYSTSVGPTAVDVADAEDLASEIRTWQPLLVPGIFQTSRYSMYVIRTESETGQSEDALSIEEVVELREARKQILAREQPPRIWSIMSEGAVRMRVGGISVMREQLDRLIELSQYDTITLQIMPFEAGVHAGVSGPFVLMSFGAASSEDIVYREGFGGDGAFNDDPVKVHPYSARFSSLQAQALSPASSLAHLKSIAEDL